MRPHGKNGFQGKFQITKNKGRPIIKLSEIFPTMLIVFQIWCGHNGKRKKVWVFLSKGFLPLDLIHLHYGEFREEEKALNLVEIVVDKLTIGIKICDFQKSGLTCINMALMLLGSMVPGEELREEENKNALLEEV